MRRAFCPGGGWGPRGGAPWRSGRRGLCARCPHTPPDPGLGRAWVSPGSPAGNPSPRASSFLLLPAACRAPPPSSRAPSLLFPSPGRRRLLLLLLPFSLDLSLPARNPFRPGSRSGQAAVCPTRRPSRGPPFRASVCRCARPPAGPEQRTEAQRSEATWPAMRDRARI